MLEQLQQKNRLFYWKQSMWNMASVGEESRKDAAFVQKTCVRIMGSDVI